MIHSPSGFAPLARHRATGPTVLDGPWQALAARNRRGITGVGMRALWK